jgi:hypothetical protein
MGFFEVYLSCGANLLLNFLELCLMDCVTAISPSCKLQSFHGRQGHLGVCSMSSTRAIAEMSFAEIPQQKLQNYLRAFASWHGINTNDCSSHISYNTRVESVKKRCAEDGSRIGWTLIVKEVLKTSYNTTRAKWTTQVWTSTKSYN